MSALGILIAGKGDKIYDLSNAELELVLYWCAMFKVICSLRKVIPSCDEPTVVWSLSSASHQYCFSLACLSLKLAPI